MATIVQDAFTDADGTSLDAHTPDTAPVGSSWAEELGNWQITGNKACLASASTWSQAIIESGVADCTISANVNANGATNNGGQDAGLVARWANNGTYNDYWRIGINQGGDQFRIIECNDTLSQTTRAFTTVTILAGTEYAIAATLNAATITATVDGGDEISYASATRNQTATIHGIAAYATADRIDALLVETAAAGSPQALEGVTTGTATVSASLAGTTASLTGASTAAAATSAVRLESTKPVSGTAAGTSATSGTLTSTKPLAGASTGTATVSATGLLSADAIAGQSDGTSTATATLQSIDALSATTAGTSTATADLTVGTPGAVALSGQTDGTSAASGALSSAKPVASASTGTATATGALGNTKALEVSAAGAATVSGALSVDRSLAGSIAGTSGVTANLQRALALTGSVAGASSVIGAIGVPKALTGQSDGAGAASGTLGVVALSLTELGTSMAAGNKLMATGSLMRSVR